MTCSHLDMIRIELPTTVDKVGAGCETCIELGMRWLHLRQCRTCGSIGCCDSSPGRHASQHAAAQDHPIITSMERGEDWSWCNIDDEQIG